ncbi:hypothetical protein BDZ90DRAFT_262221 [Jaminaea rosea]|uniref:Uncharacterized protein n=1 Tax=Jaminaea rosea TaxID=1569628 RepID=A0A316UKW3_9BASI|nr:hypothetical protein BDZ90DRAFT_262221 [Jaminaea rosea]PWN25574.1 hypothetical protein BDZ90DRAFT_262221 [Jaminaea rosea]
MPPSSNNAASSAAPIHVPRATQSRLKDALSRIRAVLVSNKASAVDHAEADKAIRILLDDPNAVPPTHTTQPEATQLAAQIAQKFNADLVDVWLKEMDQGDATKSALLVGFLAQLGEFLGASAIIMEWWDLVLRPVLKDPSASDRTAANARQLAVLAASAVASNAYQDEPEPTPSWPAPAEQSQTRKAGDAPYPKASTEPTTPNRKSSSTLKGSPATTRRSAPAADMHRRFTQRLFDLYVQEASAPLGTDEDDDEKLEAVDQMQASTASLESNGTAEGLKHSYLWHAIQPDNLQPSDVAATAWKGNLEAILITFGQGRPKEFFHHLSSSYEEPMHRIPILLLLTIFTRLSSIHTFHITSTRLPQDIITSLRLDTSTTLVSLCITALIILIPQIPNWIANGGAGGVPILLLTYARIVDWRKLGPGWEQRLGEGEEMENLRRQLDEEFTEMERLSRRLTLRPEVKWRRLESKVDTDHTGDPDALRFFTVVYGLFPCNMIRFLRAPIDYLRKANCVPLLDSEWEDLIDETNLQLRSEPILRRHTLHPALVELTAEREITDKQRWIHHDAADTTAECISLSVESWQGHRGAQTPVLSDVVFGARASAGQSARGSRSASPRRLMNSEHRQAAADDVLSAYTELRWGGMAARRPSTGGAARGSPFHRSLTVGNVRSASESPAGRSRMPTITPLNVDQPSQAAAALSSQLRRNQASAPTSPTRSSSSRRPFSAFSTITASNLPSAARRLTGIETPSSPTTPHSELPASSSSSSVHVDQTDRAAKLEVYSELKYLQRENLLLRNELNFELYLKDQHLRHIGHLHRDRINDTRLEAERQNLYQTVKLLRSQLAAVTATQERQRAEQQTTKARHAQWEAELNGKLKQYREERKTWNAETRELRAKIEEGVATMDTQSKRLDESSAELFELRTQLEKAAPRLARLDQVEARNAHLTRCLAYWDDDVRRFEEQRREMETMLSRWREMELIVRASEEDRYRISEVAEARGAECQRLRREVEAMRRRGAAAASDTEAVEQLHEKTAGLAEGQRDVQAEKERSTESMDVHTNKALQRRVEQLEAELLALRVATEGRNAAPAAESATGEGANEATSAASNLGAIGLANRKELEEMIAAGGVENQSEKEDGRDEEKQDVEGEVEEQNAEEKKDAR